MESLSPYESSLINDADIIHAKNKILEKIATLFAMQSQVFTAIINKNAPQFGQVPPKISRGEKYLNLPYIILDYPRLFTKVNSIAIRTLFWWGNYFSITLQLQGIFQKKAAPFIEEAIKNGKYDGWFLQVDGNIWQHSINEDYKIISYKGSYDLSNTPFVKITKKIPLDEWDNIDKILETNFKLLVTCI